MASFLLTLAALVDSVMFLNVPATVSALLLAAGTGGRHSHKQTSIIPINNHLRDGCAQGTAGARLTHLVRVVRTLRRRIHRQRIAASTATGTAAVSKPDTALHAHLFASCACAALTTGRSLLHCREAAMGV
jgi:hypothetical protein